MNETLEPVQIEAPKKKSVANSFFLWFARARYFTFSAIIHLIIVILAGGVVLFEQAMEQPDFMAEGDGLVGDAGPPAPPAPSQPQMNQATDFSASTTTDVSATSMPSMTALVSNSMAATSFSLPATMTPNIPTTMEKAMMNAKQPSAAPGPSMSNALSKGQASRIAGFTGGWAKGGTGSMGKPLKSREFQFTAFLAKYAGGDWNGTVWMDKDEIRGGSLPNLLFVITKLSRSKINAQPKPIPLDLSSDVIFKEKPPFIWFTGHRDFKLTDTEVSNLAEYLRSGGCIWGDSSLPGRRSRFDLAFRREMERLVPPGEKWYALPANHPIYTKAYYPEIRTVPPGINFYDEPVYALNGYGGEIAILYTANDYGDMWQFGIDENGKFDLSRDEQKRMVAVNEQMWHRRNLYFRNIEEVPLYNTYKFGTNIVVHLLTRWEEKVRNAPRMMDASAQ